MKVFGVPLEECPDRNGVIVPLSLCVGHLAKASDDAFAAAAAAEGSLHDIKTRIDQGDSTVQITDPASAAALMIMYLKSLPDPVIYSDIRDCMAMVLLEALGGMSKHISYFHCIVALFSPRQREVLVALCDLPCLRAPSSRACSVIAQALTGTTNFEAPLAFIAEHRATILAAGRDPVYKAIGKAMYDYASGQDGDLPLLNGDWVFATDTSEPGGWWQGEVPCTGMSGTFPSSYIALLAARRARSAPQAQGKAKFLEGMERLAEQATSDSDSITDMSRRIALLQTTLPDLAQQLNACSIAVDDEAKAMAKLRKGHATEMPSRPLSVSGNRSSRVVPQPPSV